MPKVVYPAFLIEDQPNELSMMDNVSSRFQHTTFSRLPVIDTFVEGEIFDSEGNVHQYRGMSGWPLFPNNWIKTVLEILIIPAIISKLLELVFPIVPSIEASKHLTIEEYKKRILDSIERFYPAKIASKERQSLSAVLESKNSYLEVLQGVEDWRYYGGDRDEDGHLLGKNGEPIA